MRKRKERGRSERCSRKTKTQWKRIEVKEKRIKGDGKQRQNIQEKEEGRCGLVLLSEK